VVLVCRENLGDGGTRASVSLRRHAAAAVRERRGACAGAVRSDEVRGSEYSGLHDLFFVKASAGVAARVKKRT
jgi:hypothetical protein